MIEFDVVEDQALDADALEEDRVAGDGGFGLVEEVGGVGEVGGSEEVGGFVVAASEEFRIGGGGVDEIEVLEEGFAGGAVVAVEEFSGEGALVERGVPEEVGFKPDAELEEIAGGVVEGVGLFEYADDVVGGEETQVGSDGGEVGVRDEVVGEVGDIVPDEEVVGDLGPAFEIGAEILGFEGVGKVGFDGTEADQHVWRGAGDFWGFTRPLVGEGFDEEVGVLLGDFGGDGVDAAEQGAGGGAVFLFDGAAEGALAGVEAVFLADGDNAGGGIFADLGEDVFDEFFAEVGVGPAELAPVVITFAVDLAVPVGVFVEVGGGGDEFEGGVAPADDGVVAAEVGGDFFVMAVDFEMSGEGGVADRVGVVAFAVEEGWRVGEVEIGDGEGGRMGGEGFAAGPPAEAYGVFEEGVDGVEGATRAGAGEEEVVRGGLNKDRIIGSRCRGDFDDGGSGGDVFGGLDVEGCAGDFVEGGL